MSKRTDSENESAEPSDRQNQTSLSKPPVAPAATRESIRESLRTDSRRDARRDPRTDPDEDSASSERIEIVSVDAPRDAAGAALGSLRRELARLQHQAGAVERTLDDHRRERTESTDRLGRAMGTVIELERKLAAALSENEALHQREAASRDDLQRIAGERDQLVLAVEDSKRASAETTKLKAQLEEAKKSHDALDAQLTEVRKRQYQESLKVTEKDGELASLRLKLEKASLTTRKLEADAVKAKAEIAESRGAAAKASGEAERARRDETERRDKELARAQDENKRLSADVEALTHAEREHQAQLAGWKSDAAIVDAARDAADAKAREEVAKALAERDAAAANATARFDELQATVSALESRAIGAEAKAMQAAAFSASEEARALEAEHARARLEQGVRDLRREISAAFGRLESIAPPPLERTTGDEHNADVIDVTSLALTASEVPPPLPARTSYGTERQTSDIPLSRLATAPPSYDPSLVIPNDSATRAVRMGTLPPPEPTLPSHAETIGSPTSTAPTVVRAHGAVPPPLPVQGGSAREKDESDMPELTSSEAYISVSDELAKAIKPDSLVDALETSPFASEPPAAQVPLLTDATDPVAAPSSPPPTPERAQSVAPPGVLSSPSAPLQREQLLAKLVDPDQKLEAARELRMHPEWLNGPPPAAFVACLVDIDYDSEAPVFDLARSWEREPLCRALLVNLRAPGDNRLREHSAWLLKHLAVPSAAGVLSDVVKNDQEPIQLRRWLLEALDRLAAGRLVGWADLGDVVTTLSHHSDATIRDGVVGILTSLERSEEKSRALMDILRRDDDEGVLSSAVEALASVLPIELDTSVAERLLSHKSGRVQRSVRELIERARRESRRPSPT